MKKDIKKRFFLAAMVASLALLWGGVTSCSNGNDNDDKPKDENTSTETSKYTFGNDEVSIAEAEKFDGEIESISITVTNIDDSAITYDSDGNPSWWFWAKTDDKGDDLIWNDSLKGFSIDITAASKITYIQQNGLKVKGLEKLKADVSYTVNKKATPPSSDDTTTGTGGSGNESGDNVNGDNTQTPGGSDDNENVGDNNTKTKEIVKDFSLSSVTPDVPGVTVAESSLFSQLSESNTITITVTCNSWNTTDGKDTWFCYCIDGSSWKGDINKWASPNISATISGEDIATLKSGKLTIYGNNTDCTVTVTWE